MTTAYEYGLKYDPGSIMLLRKVVNLCSFESQGPHIVRQKFPSTLCISEKRHMFKILKIKQRIIQNNFHRNRYTGIKADKQAPDSSKQKRRCGGSVNVPSYIREF